MDVGMGAVRVLSGSKDVGSDNMRMWGGLMRRLRIEAGITYEALSAHVGYSKSLIVGIERGTRMPSAQFVAKADELLGANGLLIEAAEHLSRERFASWREEYTETEKGARVVLAYDTHVLHDLLQTEAYARAVLGACHPTLDEAQIEAQVSGRLERQALLTRQPTCALAFVVDEWALRHATGGPAVMAAQLEHLAALGGLRNVTLQVMPASYGCHAGVDGPLTLLGLPRHHWLAYLEIQRIGQIIVDPDHVSALHERHGMIRSQALTPRDSTALLHRLAKDLPTTPAANGTPAVLSPASA